MTTTTLDSRIRQIAVLVASVDTTAARQVLLNLPTEIAKRVRAMAADMGPIPPEERRALMAEFQRHQLQQTPVTQSSAAPIDHSLQAAGGVNAERSIASLMTKDSPSVDRDRHARAFAELNSPAKEESLVRTAANSWTGLGVEALVRLVSIERPTVIAVVLQQLPAVQASAVLQRLPNSMTRQVLISLGSMQDIDDEAMRAIDEHLSERLKEFHHKMETEYERTRRVNELLAAAPSELKQQWSSWLRPDLFAADAESASTNKNSRPNDKPLASTARAVNSLDQLYSSATITTSDAQLQLAATATAQQVVKVAPASANPKQVASQLHDTAQSNDLPKAKIAQGTAEANTNVVKSASTDQTENEGPVTIPFSTHLQEKLKIQKQKLQAEMDSMLKLDPHSLAQMLSSVDGPTVLLSLAGASPNFMKRFRTILVPEDAQVLDERIRQIGPINLRQIDEAQQRLVEVYQAFKASKSFRQRAA